MIILDKTPIVEVGDVTRINTIASELEAFACESNMYSIPPLR